MNIFIKTTKQIKIATTTLIYYYWSNIYLEELHHLKLNGTEIVSTDKNKGKSEPWTKLKMCYSISNPYTLWNNEKTAPTEWVGILKG